MSIRIATCTACAGIHTVQADAQKTFGRENILFFLSSDEKIYGARAVMARALQNKSGVSVNN